MALAKVQMDGADTSFMNTPNRQCFWENLDVDRLASTEGVMRTELGQCEFGLTSKDELGETPATKPISLFTNSV